MIFFSSVTLTASPMTGISWRTSPMPGTSHCVMWLSTEESPIVVVVRNSMRVASNFPAGVLIRSRPTTRTRSERTETVERVLPARKRESEPRKLVAGIHLRRQDLVPRRDLYILYLHGAEQFIHLLRSLDVQDRRIGIDRPTFDDRNSLPRVGKLDAAVVACRNELVQRGCLHFADRLLVDQVRSGVGANPWSGGRCGGGGEQQRQKNEAFHRTGMLYGG